MSRDSSLATRYIVLLEPGVWIAPCAGDPGRTLVEDNAERFDFVEDARTALAAACGYRPFLGAKIEEV